MVKVDNGVGMSVEVGGADNRGDAVVDGEKDVEWVVKSWIEKIVSGSLKFAGSSGKTSLDVSDVFREALEEKGG